MSRPAAELQGIVKRFGETLALDRIDLAIEEGSFVVLQIGRAHV